METGNSTQSNAVTWNDIAVKDGSLTHLSLVKLLGKQVVDVFGFITQIDEDQPEWLFCVTHLVFDDGTKVELTTTDFENESLVATNGVEQPNYNDETLKRLFTEDHDFDPDDWDFGDEFDDKE